MHGVTERSWSEKNIAALIFVFGNNTPTRCSDFIRPLINLESKIIWQNAKGLENLNIPSAADRYSKYEGIETLPKEELHWVIPTPSKIVLQDENFDFPAAAALAASFPSTLAKGAGT